MLSHTAIHTLGSHAHRRSQQRGIPGEIVEWLYEFGEREWDHRGAIVLYMTKRARSKIESAIGRDAIRRNHEYLNCYAVIGVDGSLITCGHRFKKIHRH